MLRSPRGSRTPRRKRLQRASGTQTLLARTMRDTCSYPNTHVGSTLENLVTGS